MIRDMMFRDKSTFSDFASSSEHMASSILADRLYKLECNGIVSKVELLDDKKKKRLWINSQGRRLTSSGG